MLFLQAVVHRNGLFDTYFFMQKFKYLSLILVFLSFCLPRANAVGVDLTEHDISTVVDDESASVSPCLDDYRKVRNTYAVASGLAPIVGIAGIGGTAMLAFGWEYGGWFALKAALGPLVPAAGVVFSHVLPTVVLVGAVSYETVAISRFRKASHAYRLLKDVYTIGDGKMLTKLTLKVQKSHPEITKEMIQNELLLADQNKQLCDGSLVTTRRSFLRKNSLVRKLAFMKDITNFIVAD